MNKKYSIFISSTYSDLKDYRKSIHDAINKLKKLGLIILSDVTSNGKTSIFWKITKKGKYFYNLDN